MEVRREDRSEAASGPPHPIVVVLDRLRSAYNVGNIFRLAEICRIERIITCGYTATPPHQKLAKTARGCDELVPCEHRPDALTAIQELRQAGYQTVAIETVEAAPSLWESRWQTPVAFVFGNEALGIEEEALKACDSVTQLPVYGQKNSLNVGNCAAVVLFHAVQRLNGG